MGPRWLPSGGAGVSQRGYTGLALNGRHHGPSRVVVVGGVGFAVVIAYSGVGAYSLVCQLRCEVGDGEARAREWRDRRARRDGARGVSR